MHCTWTWTIEGSLILKVILFDCSFRSSSNSSGPGSYVKEYIGIKQCILNIWITFLSDRILLPVFTSLTIFPTEVQQVVGRLAIKTLCDSWLEHIAQKKFKFRWETCEGFEHVNQLAILVSLVQCSLLKISHFSVNGLREVSNWLKIRRGTNIWNWEYLAKNILRQVLASSGQH